MSKALSVKKSFDEQILIQIGQPLYNQSLETIQVNVGLKCNQSCEHCHVSSSPKRKEVMDWPVMEKILEVAKETKCKLVDITGGAPELNPNLRKFISALSKQGQKVQVRTNLTVLLEPDQETMIEFFSDNKVKLVASLPCYLQENVDKQRGLGVYLASIEALKRLNKAGYGILPGLILDLVYNPLGSFLPPDQEKLEKTYKKELWEMHKIQFNQLLTITNMSIGRFSSDLRKQSKSNNYKELLENTFNTGTIDRLMCLSQIEVDWDGNLYDCDFNLALRLKVDKQVPQNIKDFDINLLKGRKIVTANHCFGCTAGRGSSCAGALA
ncbi:MAG: arsenosugar biosynthesis radical SAM protein ArsS [Acidobacteria bacterium]|nr:arsenosugar biosynthesis radical SAM protein ArsS [Acidobacteriota bacterium]